MEDVHGLSTDRGFSWIFHICLSGTTGASSPESPESGLVHGTVRSVERKEWLRHQTHVVRQGYRVPDQGATLGTAKRGNLNRKPWVFTMKCGGFRFPCSRKPIPWKKKLSLSRKFHFYLDGFSDDYCI